MSIYKQLCASALIILLSAPSMGRGHNYRGEIEMPTRASDIRVLLGVPKKNWSTFNFGECDTLAEWASAEQSLFSIENERKHRRVYLKGGQSKESEIEGAFFSCLREINFIKKQVSDHRKYTKIIKEIDIPRLKAKHPGFKVSGITLAHMVHNNIKKSVYPDDKEIYPNDVYHWAYSLLQMTDKNTGLFWDSQGTGKPPILLIAPDERQLIEGDEINAAADYYTFEGVRTYTNTRGFERKAYLMRGHIDATFKYNWYRRVYAGQWIDGKVNLDGSKVNTDGM